MRFDAIIAPVVEEAFFKTFWERRFLHVPRCDPEYFGSLVGLDDIDKEISRADTRYPNVRAVRADEDIPKDEYVLSNGRIDAVKLYQCFENGATIILNQGHRRISTLADFCRLLEQKFSFPIQTNLYLTPPGAQGFKLHYDTHDVFALQIVGAKKWNVYEAAIELPLYGQEFDPSVTYEPGEAVTFASKPGDTVYIPRAILHEAISSDEISLHVTVGIISTRWAELMVESLSAACLTDAQFRRSLPIGFSNPDNDVEKMKEKFRILMREAMNKLDFGATLDHFIESFISTREVPVGGQLSAIIGVKDVNLETILRRRPGIVYRIIPKGENCTVYFGGRTIEFPIHCTKLLQKALSGESVTAQGLAGEIDPQSCLVLVQRLVREGLLN